MFWGLLNRSAYFSDAHEITEEFLGPKIIFRDKLKRNQLTIQKKEKIPVKITPFKQSKVQYFYQLKFTP